VEDFSLSPQNECVKKGCRLSLNSRHFFLCAAGAVAGRIRVRCALSNVFHYTDKDGWNAIRSQLNWRFKAAQPRDPQRPRGAYFTDLEPSQANLRTLHERLRVPKSKQQFVFWFVGTDDLSQWKDGRGRDQHIYFSPHDYDVAAARQRSEGATDEVSKEFA